MEIILISVLRQSYKRGSQAHDLDPDPGAMQGGEKRPEREKIINVTWGRLTQRSPCNDLTIATFVKIDPRTKLTRVIEGLAHR